MVTPRSAVSSVLPLVEAVTAEHRDWAAANGEATLSELRARLELATEQCRGYVLAGDLVLADRSGVPSPLNDELALWPPAGPGLDAPERFSDAGVLLAGYSWRLAVLESLVGDVPLSRLLDAAP